MRSVPAQLYDGRWLVAPLRHNESGHTACPSDGDILVTDEVNPVSSATNILSDTGPVRDKKRQPRRYRYDKPEMVARLEAVVQMNPFQYPLRTDERRDAWDAAIDHPGTHIRGNTPAERRRVMETYIIKCLQYAPQATRDFNDAAGPVFQRYMQLLNTLIDLKKKRSDEVSNPLS
ncbi:uncharacterized protein LOC129602538 [Paramacrobiotus metropolitanus]|uniref:uncharacterized protein LOC129602538 n=1 Tax=Paramacrobiotus metropolitanus TaxID=2943436 RepID=UPI002445B0D1|nr:uncharacterized protein LOC129602538 [Paramacrobiotus metropolitanus]